jgi:hypothetical protein
MKTRLLYFLIIIVLTISSTFSQVENVPLTHPVYTFLKEMKVKRIIPYINEDLSNLSRFEVRKHLETINNKSSELSLTEIRLLNRYKAEFYESMDADTTTYFFHPDKSFSTSLSEVFSNKVKYLYAYREKNANVYMDLLGHIYYGQTFKPEVNNTSLFDGGIRIRGTVFDHLGYNFAFLKGGASGSREVAELIEPRLLYSFKWIEDAENIGNYDFTTGYIKYHTEPAEDMNLSIQVGREHKTVGYGYSSKLVLSGDNPPLDFIQFNFDYGIVNFTSIHGSTVGEFSMSKDARFTKYWVFNRLKLKFENLFDVGIGESIVYSGRGLELAYLTPVGFYKFIEHSIQDRDNANLYFDFQSGFIENLEFQATFLLDENILSNLQDLDKYTNKTAYQVGAFWYQPFSINDLSLILEYTKIRPFVYTHFDSMNVYTAFGKNLGHRIGPNADELFSRLSYNFNDWIRLNIVYAHIRRGENIYDDEGNLIKNVGGDIYLSHGHSPENTTAIFLDGVRINNDVFEIGMRIEPARDFIFDIIYNYNIESNLTTGNKDYLSYGFIRFTLNY